MINPALALSNPVCLGVHEGNTFKCYFYWDFSNSGLLSAAVKGVLFTFEYLDNNPLEIFLFEQENTQNLPANKMKRE